MAITDTFDGVASMLTHGGAAQDFLVQIALPYASAYYAAAIQVLEPLAMIGLIAAFIMWFVFPTGQVKSFFVGLLIAVILLYPGQYRTGDSALWFSSAVPTNPADVTGNPDTDITYPMSIIIFFNVLGYLERGLYKTVNGAMNQFDGSMADGILPSRIMSLVSDSSTLATASPELVSLHRLYRNECEPEAAKLGLTNAQMQALGFNNSIIVGVQDTVGDPEQTVSFWRSLFPMKSTVVQVDGDALSNVDLVGISASAAASGVFLESGSRIPSSSYFSDRENGATPGSNAFLKRSEVGGEDFAHPNPSASPNDSTRFYASNCDELHDMVKFGNQQYYAFIEGMEIEQGELVEDAGWGEWLWGAITVDSPVAASTNVDKLVQSKFMGNMHAMNRAITEANGYQSLGGSNRGGNGALESGMDGVDTAIKSVGLSVSSWWKRWHLDLAPAAANAVVAMGVALLFIMLPLVIVFSVLPGRIAALATVIKVILFAKLTLLLMYITAKLGIIATASSMFAVKSMEGMPTSLYSAQLSLAMTSQIVSLVVILTAAPMLAYFLVFSETKGLSSLKPGSIGQDATRNAAIAAGTALQVGRVAKAASGAMPNPAGGAPGSGASPGKGVPSK